MSLITLTDSIISIIIIVYAIIHDDTYIIHERQLLVSTIDKGSRKKNGSFLSGRATKRGAKLVCHLRKKNFFLM